MKKLAALIIVSALFFSSSCGLQKPKDNQEETKEKLKIGVLLPLSGPAIIWGQSLKRGIEIAEEDVSFQNIDFVYEDNQASPTVAISAYEKLKSVDKIDAVFATFSRTGVPLASLAERDKIPMIVTLAAGNDIADLSPYAFRLSYTAKQFAGPQFQSLVQKNGYKEIAVIYVNDEYGSSVNSLIVDFAKNNNIEVALSEPVEVGTTDFKTQLAKFSAKKPDALLFALGSPAETLGLVRQIQEMQIQEDILEVSAVLSDKQSRGDSIVKPINIYTNALSFSLGLSGQELTKKYQEKYHEDPPFAVALGYDMAKLIAEATKGEKMSGEKLVEKILQLKTFDGANGTMEIQPNGEINPELHAVKIVDNKLVLN